MVSCHWRSMVAGIAVVSGIFFFSGETQAAQEEAGRNEEQKQLVLNTSNLENQVLITRLFEGDFSKIELDRADDFFSNLLSFYVRAFSNKCGNYLPSNKVELTATQCATERVTRNGYGVEVDRSCVKYETVRTGVYVTPEMDNTMTTLASQNSADTGRKLSQAFTQATDLNAMQNKVNTMIGDMKSAGGDMNKLIELNGCSSPGLKRFDENIQRFALNKLPILLGESKTTGAGNSASQQKPPKNFNYLKLIGDLIVDDSKQWGAFSQLVPGSIDNAVVDSRDNDGHPTRVVVNYAWESMLGRVNGTALLTFNEGIPECLTYSATPTVCHAANRQISARYLQGEYNQ